MKNGLAILEKAKQEARKILLDAKEEASFCISQMNEISKNMSANSVKELNHIRNQLNASLKETSSVIVEEIPTPTTVLEEDLKIGCHVYIDHLAQEGVILSLPNKSKQVQVQIGSMKMLIPVAHISKILHANTSSSNGVANFKTNKAKTATTEINVIGYHVDEAIFMIDKYLDDCVVAKLNSVRIVHGKGTGSLRKGIHDFLKAHSHVKNFRLGTFGEGEMGVTVVELK